MRCERAIIYYRDGKPDSYCLIATGTEKPAQAQGAVARETSFKEAYQLFSVVRKHWNADGTAKA
jgi:hypothetical protein